MKEIRKKLGKQAVICLVAFFLGFPMDLMAQTAEESSVPEQSKYTQEELDQLLAPIALYPDSLLASILMASTYPIEVVEADRWLKQHPGLTRQKLDDALQDKPWDPSVKSLCNFPEVLATMSDKLSETAEMGNAFLEQRDEVMNTVQRLRAKAKAEGNLQSNDKHEVTVEGEDIIINPPQPDIIYVPAYNPCLVYGPWWYPTCSPPWFWYPRLVIGVGLTFGPGIFIGPIGGWCGFYWHRHRVFVNPNKTLFFHRPGISRMHGGVEVWRHNPHHRRGYAYFGRETRRRFGHIYRPGKAARRAYRGFPRGGGISGRQRQPEGLRHSGPGFRQSREGAAFPSYRSRQFGRGNAFEGFGRNRNEIRRFSERGHESMGYNRGRNRSRGGFYRGGRHR